MQNTTRAGFVRVAVFETPREYNYTQPSRRIRNCAVVMIVTSNVRQTRKLPILREEAGALLIALSLHAASSNDDQGDN